MFAEPPRAIADFQLTDQAGKTVKLADLRGAPVLMFFGFTHCSQICPTALHQLRQLEREHRAELGKTRIVIVSVDGERDSPAAMKAWLQPISTSFIGLTGAPTGATSRKECHSERSEESQPFETPIFRLRLACGSG